jgi:error-prone DNA polymerase
MRISGLRRSIRQSLVPFETNPRVEDAVLVCSSWLAPSFIRIQDDHIQSQPMPDQPPPKHVLHPSLRCSGDAGHDAPDGTPVPFPRARWPRDIQWGELLVQSNHSFLSGASHPEELVEQAIRLGHAGIALTDIDSVGGAVRAHVAARDGMGAGSPLKLAHGTRTRLLLETPAMLSASPSDGQPSIELALYASSRSSWGALCRLLSHRGLVPDDSDDSAPQRRGKCPRTLHELIGVLRDHPGGADLLAVLIPPSVPDQSFLEAAEGLASILTDERLAVAMHRTDEAEGVLAAERACVLADALGVPVVATGDVRMHAITRKPLLDTLACIRAGTSIQRAQGLLAPNAERRLKPLDDVLRRYADRHEALHAAWRFLDRASRFSLAELRYEYPEEVVPPEFSAQGWTAMEYLKSITWKGARERYPRGIPPKVARQLEHEFAIIDDLRYAPYFLTVHEIDRLADGGEHPQREHVDLEHAERLDVVLVPFDDGAIVHRSMLDGHGLEQRRARDDEAADML